MLSIFFYKIIKDFYNVNNYLNNKNIIINYNINIIFYLN